MDIPIYKVWDSLRREWFDSEAQARYVLDNARSRLELMFFLAPAGVVVFADGSLGLVDKADGYRWAPLDPERFKVVWWSGKKDKNGEPAYQGDALFCGDYKSLNWRTVELRDGTFGYEELGEFSPLRQDILTGSWEVISNIYEHPELGAES